MRDRRLLALVISAAAILVFGVYGVVAAPGAVVASPSPRPSPSGDPDESDDPDVRTNAVRAGESPTPLPVSPPPNLITLTPATPNPQSGPETTVTNYFTAWQGVTSPP